MIPSLTSATDTESPLAVQASSTIVPLQQRLAGASILLAEPPHGLGLGDDSLLQAFLAALRSLRPCDDPRDYDAAVSKLMREFVDPRTGQAAFVTLEAQVEILQRALAEVGPDNALAVPLKDNLDGTLSLQHEVQIFLAALRTLPPSDDPNDYAAAVSKLMREFVDPDTGQAAFVTLEAQVAILQWTLVEVGPNNALAVAINGALIGTMNLQYEMREWMQKIFMSDGSPEELKEW
ncbi:hypothetical protein [Chromobacterium amazonense]|uniref:hypothetical protein n=1 Tax=Chromobacterium amazonense TaxID=1382803 RepID=UPI003F799B24